MVPRVVSPTEMPTIRLRVKQLLTIRSRTRCFFIAPASSWSAAGFVSHRGEEDTRRLGDRPPQRVIEELTDFEQLVVEACHGGNTSRCESATRSMSAPGTATARSRDSAPPWPSGGGRGPAREARFAAFRILVSPSARQAAITGFSVAVTARLRPGRSRPRAGALPDPRHTTPTVSHPTRLRADPGRTSGRTGA